MSKRVSYQPGWSEATKRFKQGDKDTHKLNAILSPIQLSSPRDITSTGVYSLVAYRSKGVDVGHACFVVVNNTGKYIFNVNDDRSYSGGDGWDLRKFAGFRRPLLERDVAIHSNVHGACQLLSEALRLLYLKLNCDMNVFIRALLDRDLTELTLLASVVNN